MQLARHLLGYHTRLGPRSPLMQEPQAFLLRELRARFLRLKSGKGRCYSVHLAEEPQLWTGLWKPAARTDASW